MNKGALVIGGGVLVALLAAAVLAKADEPKPNVGPGPRNTDAEDKCAGWFAAKAVLRNQRESAKAYLVDIDAALMTAYANGDDASSLEVAKAKQVAAVNAFDAEISKLDTMLNANGC